MAAGVNQKKKNTLGNEQLPFVWPGNFSFRKSPLDATQALSALSGSWAGQELPWLGEKASHYCQKEEQRLLRTRGDDGQFPFQEEGEHLSSS